MLPHEPMVNRTYADLARPLQKLPFCQRGRIIRGIKLSLKLGVQIVGRWILARLRDRRFFSLARPLPN